MNRDHNGTYTPAPKSKVPKSKLHTVGVPGVGSVVINKEDGWIQPINHTLGMRLGIGCAADDAKKAKKQMILRSTFKRLAENTVNRSLHWRDHDGNVWQETQD